MPATKPISCAVEQRCIIKFLAKEQVKPIEIYKRLLIQFGDLCLAKSNVYTWIERFKNGRESVLDDERNHMQPNAVTPQNIIRTEKLIKTNPRISVRDLAADLGISVGSIQNILRKKLKLTKLDDKWVQLEKKEERIKQQQQQEEEEEGEEDEMVVDDKGDERCSNCSIKISNKKRRKKSPKRPTTTAKTSKSDPPLSLPPSPSPSSSSTTIITASSEETTQEKQTQQQQQSSLTNNDDDDDENIKEKKLKHQQNKQNF